MLVFSVDFFVFCVEGLGLTSHAEHHGGTADAAPSLRSMNARTRGSTSLGFCPFQETVPVTCGGGWWGCQGGARGEGWWVASSDVITTLVIYGASRGSTTWCVAVRWGFNKAQRNERPAGVVRRAKSRSPGHRRPVPRRTLASGTRHAAREGTSPPLVGGVGVRKGWKIRGLPPPPAGPRTLIRHHQEMLPALLCLVTEWGMPVWEVR